LHNILVFRRTVTMRRLRYRLLVEGPPPSVPWPSPRSCRALSSAAAEQVTTADYARRIAAAHEAGVSVDVVAEHSARRATGSSLVPPSAPGPDRGQSSVVHGLAPASTFDAGHLPFEDALAAAAEHGDACTPGAAANLLLRAASASGAIRERRLAEPQLCAVLERCARAVTSSGGEAAVQSLTAARALATLLEALRHAAATDFRGDRVETAVTAVTNLAPSSPALTHPVWTAAVELTRACAETVGKAGPAPQ
jgi:hypothetical protein